MFSLIPPFTPGISIQQAQADPALIDDQPTLTLAWLALEAEAIDDLDSLCRILTAVKNSNRASAFGSAKRILSPQWQAQHQAHKEGSNAEG